MTKNRKYTAPSGRTLTDDEIEGLADDVATKEYDVEQIRRRGRPSIGSGPAQLVPVRAVSRLLPAILARPRTFPPDARRPSAAATAG
jgi:hypothetical protein